MSVQRRGFFIFGGLVLVTAIFCIGLPFFWLPGAGLGMGLPTISLPAEPLIHNILPSFLGSNFTNTMTSLIVVDVIILLIALTVRRAITSAAPDRFVPRGLTNGIEMIAEFWYNEARKALGNFAPRVFPLAFTVFMFLLIGNWTKLIPGFESVGFITCAEAGKSGYPLKGNGPLLEISGASLKDRAGVKPTQAAFTACEDRLAKGEPAAPEDRFNVLPFFRALATDLNFPLALAIIVFFSVEAWGVRALGLGYFFKFINVPALGNIAKKPMGVMDFVVGLVEIISELSRLISLSFRLLGNIFAGGVLLSVMTFLMAFVLPSVFMGLELFVGAIQAYVFATLTIMYASQAITAHHAEEHVEEHAHAESGAHAVAVS